MSGAVSEESTLTRQLWHIAGSGDLEQLDQLVSEGVDVNAGDRTGVTALMRAAYHGQLAMVRALIGYGADPNAKDRSGLDALMMAEHGGHDEIVEALRSVGARGKTGGTGVPPVNHAQDARATCGGGTEVPPVNHAQDARDTFTLNRGLTEENVDAATEHDDWEFGQTSRTARTLHEPLEIWEMVQTTQSKSYSPSASLRRVFSLRTLVLAVGALVICSGAVFGFLALRGAMSAANDTPQQQPSATAQQLAAFKSPIKAPGKTARSANELTKLKPVGKKSQANERPKATKVSASVPKQKSVRRATRLGSEQDASPKSAKKEPAPPSDPVKPNAPKPKVIQWP